MVENHDRHHGFGNRRCTNPNTRIVASLGDDFNRFSLDIHPCTRQTQAGRRFQRDACPNILAAGNAAQNPPSMVAEETLGGHFVTKIGPLAIDTIETISDLDPFNGVDTH